MSWPIRTNDLEPAYRGRLLVKVNGKDQGIDLTGHTVTFQMRHHLTNVPKVSAAAHVMTESDLDADGIDHTEPGSELGWVKYAWQSGDTDTPDLYRVEWIIDAGVLPRTVPPRSGLFIEVSDP